MWQLFDQGLRMHQSVYYTRTVNTVISTQTVIADDYQRLRILWTRASRIYIIVNYFIQLRRHSQNVLIGSTTIHECTVSTGAYSVSLICIWLRILLILIFLSCRIKKHLISLKNDFGAVLKTSWEKERLPVFSNFYIFSLNCFKCCLPQSCQTLSLWGKGLISI